MGVLIRLELDTISSENRAKISSRLQQWLTVWKAASGEESSHPHCTEPFGEDHNILELRADLHQDIIAPLLALHQTMYHLGVKIFANCRPEN